MQRHEFVEYFRSLDKALDEHKEKGTPKGHESYQKIYDQLAGDLAQFGFGRDEIPNVAQRCGHLSTFQRLEQLMTMANRPEEGRAIHLLELQLVELKFVRILDSRKPRFITWRSTTTDLLQRFLRPDSPHLITFRDIRFGAPRQVGSITGDYAGNAPERVIPSPAEMERFSHSCAVAEGAIMGAIETIRNFGLPPGTVERAEGTGGFHQVFHGPVTFQNQVVATDKAIQNIGQIGDAGTSLQAIAALLQQSMELKGREIQEGLQAIQEIASEVQTPKPKRNWSSIVGWGTKLLDITSKATDLCERLAPYLPAISTLIHEAGTHV